MPTNITHAIPALTVGLGMGRNLLPLSVILTGAFIANIPDLDMVGTRLFHLPWNSVYGHRGYTHSIFFALMMSLMTALLFGRENFKRNLMFFSFCMLSHGMLDACNEGGLGIAFFWPLSDARFHSFFQPVMNVHVSFRGLYLSTGGFPVFISEILWIWLPFICIFFILRYKVTEQWKRKILGV